MDEDYIQQLDDELNRVLQEYWEKRRQQIEAGTAKALPWHFDIMKLGWETECADGQRVLVEKNPTDKPCPHCKTIHPLEIQ